MGAKQLKIGLRVDDLNRSAELYLRLGFNEIPNDSQIGMPPWAGTSSSWTQSPPTFPCRANSQSGA